MVRKTSLALVIATVLSPISAHALGLGDIHLKSALNQDLRADIDLLSVKSGELDTVKIELAAQDAFQRAGVDRSYLLTQLRFRPVRRPDGSAVIEVTTRDAVHEPFLNFLIEVNWPQGKLVREYTVLLDPPATLSRRPPAVAAPVARATAKPARAEVSAPVGISPAPAVAETGTPGEYGPTRANETLWVIADKLRPDGVTIEQMMIALQRANPEAFYKDNVNYLKRGVILRVPKGASIDALGAADARAAFMEQTARWEAERAPHQAPPTAGAEAKPGVETAKTQPGAAAPTAPAAPAAKAPTEAELKIVAAPTEGQAGAGEGGASKANLGKLKSDLLVAREANASARQEAADLQSRVKDLEAQLADMRTLVSLKDDQLAQLQATLATGTAEAPPPGATVAGEAPPPGATVAGEAPPPEATVAGEAPPPGATVAGEAPFPGATVSGEAPPLASGSAQPAGGMPVAGVPSTPSPADEGAPVEAASMPAAPGPTPQAEQASSAAAPGAEGEPSAQEAVVMPATAERPDAGESQAAAPTEQPSGEEASMPTGSEQPPYPAPEAMPPPVSSEAQAPEQAATMPKPQPQPIGMLYWILGGALGVLVLGLGWTAVRRRKAQQSVQSDESILVDLDEEIGEASSQLLATSGESDSQTDETSFLSDFSPSDIDALQDETGEVDPVSEADVYMAYNRYQQAEELLRQAVAKEPDRADLRFKLLEVLAAAQSVDAFVAEAEKASRDGLAQDHPAEWAKVVSLGSDLAPENPLFLKTADEDFKAEPEPPEVSGDETAVVQGAGLDTSEEFGDFDLGDLESQLNMASAGMAASAGAEAEAEREDVEFGDSVFDFVNEDGPSPEAEVEVEAGAGAGAGAGGEVEIESSSDFIAESEPALGESEPAVAELDLGDFSDLDQGLEEPSRPARQPGDDAAMEMGSGLGAQDLDFNRMESIPGEDSIGLEGLDSAMSELEASEDLSLGEESTSPEGTPVEPMADMSAGIADDDEVATKLDLARAYLDMGDEEGARSILDEVLAEGSEAQQSEARGLMQRIA